ncbi:MAG: hypothetical protein P8R54_24370 [Myxococcota bacterium]|nr:hypothetical protein [Myxococcota bacterium]
MRGRLAKHHGGSVTGEVRIGDGSAGSRKLVGPLPEACVAF